MSGMLIHPQQWHGMMQAKGRTEYSGVEVQLRGKALV